MPKALRRTARQYVRRQTVTSERMVRALATPVIIGPTVGALGSLVLYVQPIFLTAALARRERCDERR
jgi:hypothetical protein